MALTYKQLISDLEAQKIAPIYLLTGEEDYYIDFLSEYFENNILDESVRDFDQIVLYGKDVTMSAVIDAAKQYPMLAPKRLLLVKEAQHLDKWDTLASYVENPQPTTILVFCYKQKKFDKRTKVYKAIAQKGIVFERAKMYDNQLPDWIRDFVRERGFDITPKAAMLVSEALGNDLGKIANEFSKLFLNMKTKLITEQDIENYIGISKDYNSFELQKALGKRNIFKVNQIINYFAANPKEHPIQQTLPLLYSFFVKLFICNQQTDKSQGALASKLGVSPFFVKDYIEACNSYNLSKLVDIIGYLKECDLKSKGLRNGTATDGELMKELMYKILH